MPANPLKAPYAQRAIMRDALQDRFSLTVKGLAGQLERTGFADVWHVGMKVAVTEHILQQAALGKGGDLGKQDLIRLSKVVRTQQAYLSRFADEVAAKQLAGTPLTTAQIVARAEQYSGAARGEWFKASEAEAGKDVVYIYHAVDDHATCSACLAAAEGSPYLGGEGPQPGSICYGRGRCRCKRIARTDKKLAKQLRREAA